MQALAEKSPATFTLMEHQKTGLEIAMSRDYFAFWDDTGVGKTLMMIAIRQMLSMKTLVVCPLNVIETAWIKDIQKFFPDLLPFTPNLWDFWRKRKNINGLFKYKNALENSRLAIVNYEGFTGQIEYLWNAGFKMVVLDESWRIASPKSAISKLMIKYCDTIKHVWPMCGTPAPNKLEEYFNQVRVMTKEVFGRSFYAFRNTYFTPDYMGYKWNLKKHMAKKFHEKLASVSRVVFKEDVLDLPERTFNVREVILSSEEAKAHKEMKCDLMTEFADVEFWAANDAVKGMKLRQITGGFLKQGPVVTQLGKSKLNALDELLTEIGRHQVIIWIQFNYEGDAIEKMFSDYNAIPSHENKKTWSRYDGTISPPKKKIAIEAFMAKESQYLIGHPNSMGHGTDGLQGVCSYTVHYSINHSYGDDHQSNDRTYRKGQYNPCTIFYLIAKDSVDPVIYSAIRAKQNASLAVLKYIQGR